MGRHPSIRRSVTTDPVFSSFAVLCAVTLLGAAVMAPLLIGAVTALLIGALAFRYSGLDANLRFLFVVAGFVVILGRELAFSGTKLRTGWSCSRIGRYM